MSIKALGILISGRGSNLKALAAACKANKIPARIAVVISNRPAAEGLQWARDQGLATAVLRHQDFPDRTSHDLAIVSRLRDDGVEWVCLAGYMRLLSPALVDSFSNRILNIHPSLLPAFPGLDAQQKALEWGVKVSGCTVHLVDRELDHGPIVVQRAVTVAEDDTVDRLAARILKQEHEAYPEALNRLLSQPWTVQGRRVAFARPASVAQRSAPVPG